MFQTYPVLQQRRDFEAALSRNSKRRLRVLRDGQRTGSQNPGNSADLELSKPAPQTVFNDQ
jgi:hypothetical protein